MQEGFEEVIPVVRPESGCHGKSDDPLLSVTYAAENERAEMWPNRLLYVPEMRSYERQEGNRYKYVTQPCYNILSYTWGRWQDRTGQAEALTVRGITWRIPAIQPHIFTAAEFKDVLLKVSAGVDWVWVDIACIDQDDSKVRDEEVGRQAGIFSRASSAFIWLHQSPTQRIQSFADELFSLANRCDGDEEYIQQTEVGDVTLRFGVDYLDGTLPSCVMDGEWMKSVDQSLAILEDEPWFSSLWTLQESYLRSAATFLSREGEQLTRQGYYEVGLVSFMSAWGQIDLAMRRAAQHSTARGDEQMSLLRANLLKRMDVLGLTAHDNPIILYSAAGFRSAIRDDDRIYGIMQVFGFKLGKSVSPGKKFSLAELELQFAAAINEKSPVWAHMFVHRIEQPPGRHWCISQSSSMPECLIMDFAVVRSHCRISVDTRGQAFFKGLSCYFDQIKAAWDNTRTGPWIPTIWRQTSPEILPVEAILLDECNDVLTQIPRGLQRLEDELTWNDGQRELGNLLMMKYGHELKVFFCGTVQTEPDDLSKASSDMEVDDMDGEEEKTYASVAILALRVVRSGTTRWQRIGVCVWTSLPKLHAASVEWTPTVAALD